MFVAIIFYELGALMPVPHRVKDLHIRHASQKIKLVQDEKVMNYLLLPHELKQGHKVRSNNILKV